MPYQLLKLCKGKAGIKDILYIIWVLSLSMGGEFRVFTLGCREQKYLNIFSLYENHFVNSKYQSSLMNHIKNPLFSTFQHSLIK